MISGCRKVQSLIFRNYGKSFCFLLLLFMFWLLYENLDLCYIPISDNGNADPNVEFIHVKDNITQLKFTDDLNEIEYVKRFEKVGYDRFMPIIFVGGVPRSGTTLMRAILDAHPNVRCGEETRLIPRMIFLRNQIINTEKESSRFKSSFVSNHLIDLATAQFILEIIVKHGKAAEHFCNKDPLVLRYSTLMKKIFPNSKYILMIRDGRASVHSIISRKVTITGFNLNSYKDCLIKWNNLMESMFQECLYVGADSCLPVHYEQLILHPEQTTRKIFSFLNITWNEAVLHHEKYIGDEITLSKVERSSDQVIKPINLQALTAWVGQIPDDVLNQMDLIAPMLRRLGYDPFANPPKYGEPDAIIEENTNNVIKNKEFWKKQILKVMNGY